MKTGTKYHLFRPGDDCPLFGVNIKDLSTSAHDFAKYISVTLEVVVFNSWGDDGNGNYVVPVYEDADDYLGIYIKWDGCSHAWFGAPRENDDGRDGYLHLCGGYCFRNLSWMIRALFHWAADILPMDTETADVERVKKPEFKMVEVG